MLCCFTWLSAWLKQKLLTLAPSWIQYKRETSVYLDTSYIFQCKLICGASINVDKTAPWHWHCLIPSSSRGMGIPPATPPATTPNQLQPEGGIYNLGGGGLSKEDRAPYCLLIGTNYNQWKKLHTDCGCWTRQMVNIWTDDEPEGQDPTVGIASKQRGFIT